VVSVKNNLKAMTTEQLVIIFHNINFHECIDPTINNKVNGEWLACVEKIEDLDDFEFQISKNTRKKLLFNKITEMINDGVPLSYLDRHVNIITYLIHTSLIILLVIINIIIHRHLILKAQIKN
jgi:hypothetical protein